MRAQLAVSSLIVFGIVLIGMGFVKLPYVSSFKDTVIMQTSAASVTQFEEPITTVFTTSYTVLTAINTSLTTSMVETVTSSTTVVQTLTRLQNLTLDPEKPLVAGPLRLNSPSTVEVSWSSSTDMELYRASGERLEQPSSWMLIGRGFSGVIMFDLAENASFYIVVRPVSNAGLLTVMQISSSSVETVVQNKTRTTTVEAKTTVTTLTYATSSHVYTTLLRSTKTDFFTVAVETTVTETRYADLSFMTAMGSFLVFVGLLLTVLLLRTLAKPVEKNSE